MSRKYSFVANNNSDEESIEKALTALRHMAELGKKAEAALAGLERDGCWNKSVYVADKSDLGDKRPILRLVRFPAFQEVSRDDAPNLAALTLTLEGFFKSQYGGHSNIEHNLCLNGSAIFDGRKGLVMKGIPQTRIGSLRVGKRSISFVDGDRATIVTTKSQRIEPMMAKIAKSEAIEAVAKKVANLAIRPDNDRFTQRGADLWKAVRRWLVKDGHVQRMLEDAVGQLFVKPVMES